MKQKTVFSFCSRLDLVFLSSLSLIQEHAEEGEGCTAAVAHRGVGDDEGEAVEAAGDEEDGDGQR